MWFLGLACCYHWFMPNFAKLSSPLTRLIRKCDPDLVWWTEQCQAAFMQVKEALCGERQLHTPNFSLLLILQTDTLNRGLGGILVSRSPGNYESRKPGTVRGKRSAWPSSGRSTSFGITSWTALSPSVQITVPVMLYVLDSFYHRKTPISLIKGWSSDLSAAGVWSSSSVQMVQLLHYCWFIRQYTL